MSEAICAFPRKPHNNLVSLKQRFSQSTEVLVRSKMAILCLIACLTLVSVSGKNLQGSRGSLYHYGHDSKPDPDTAWDFASHLNGEDAVPAVEEVSPTSDPYYGDIEDYAWDFSPLVNNNKDYLYEYVGDNWLSGEDSPYYYYSEGKGTSKEAHEEELPDKHRRKYRRLRSFDYRHRAKNGINNYYPFNDLELASKALQRKKRSIKLRAPSSLTNAEKAHPTSDLQFNPSLKKREVQFKTADLAAPAGRLQKYHLSKRNVKRRRRQLKAHQLEYYTDNDGDSQFHAPGKAEGTEWDLVPLESLKDDNEEELGIQYDKKANDASFLTAE